MPASNKLLHYQAYLLRLWGERVHVPKAGVVWRFSLEDPQTGERQGFADLQALLAFLTERIEQSGVED